MCRCIVYTFCCPAAAAAAFTLSPAGGRPRGFFSVTTGGDSASDILSCGLGEGFYI